MLKTLAHAPGEEEKRRDCKRAQGARGYRKPDRYPGALFNRDGCKYDAVTLFSASGLYGVSRDPEV